MSDKLKPSLSENYSLMPERASEPHEPEKFARCGHVGPAGNRGIGRWWNHVFKFEDGTFWALQACADCTKEAIAAPTYPAAWLWCRIQTIIMSEYELKNVVRRNETAKPISPQGERMVREILDEAKKGGIN